MEKLKLNKLFGLGVIGASVLALSACGDGDYTAPTIDDLREEGKFFELTRPDGEEMICWSYIGRGQEGYAGFSWLTVTCDWDGSLDMGSTTTVQEVVPTTTLPPVIGG